ncbi:MAG TPA: DUF4845 domain-containing protein [Casimicrobiaceae bacterium]|nr:DUF4845 domain-containing protein [Casimicrobiaceae bacterium]
MLARRQRGITFGGFLFVAAVIVVVVLIGFRVTPAVVEYYAVKQALGEALDNAKDPTALPDIQRAFQRRIDAGYIESVTPKDVELRKEGNTVIASVAWSRTMHLVANASLVLEFEATAAR